MRTWFRFSDIGSLIGIVVLISVFEPANANHYIIFPSSNPHHPFFEGLCADRGAISSSMLFSESINVLDDSKDIEATIISLAKRIDFIPSKFGIPCGPGCNWRMRIDDEFSPLEIGFIEISERIILWELMRQNIDFLRGLDVICWSCSGVVKAHREPGFPSLAEAAYPDNLDGYIGPQLTFSGVLSDRDVLHSSLSRPFGSLDASTTLFDLPEGSYCEATSEQGKEKSANKQSLCIRRQVSRVFRDFPIKFALFFGFLFVLCGALGGHFLYYERNLLGSAIIGSALLIAGLLFWLI